MAGKNLDNLGVEELEEVVRDKRELVGQIVNFVEAFLLERGRITAKEVSSDHTRVERELRQFENFSFHWVTGMTMFGGDTIEIWYHDPDQGDAEPELVFDVYYQTQPSYDVRIFTEGEWQSKLNYLMEHQEEAVKSVQQDDELDQQQVENQRIEELRVRDLQEEARKLNL